MIHSMRTSRPLFVVLNIFAILKQDPYLTDGSWISNGTGASWGSSVFLHALSPIQTREAFTRTWSILAVFPRETQRAETSRPWHVILCKIIHIFSLSVFGLFRDNMMILLPLKYCLCSWRNCVFKVAWDEHSNIKYVILRGKIKQIWPSPHKDRHSNTNPGSCCSLEVKQFCYQIQ